MGNKYVIVMGTAFQGMTLMGPFDNYQEAFTYTEGAENHVPLLGAFEIIEVQPVTPRFVSAETFAAQYEGHQLEFNALNRGVHVVVNTLEREDPATGEPEPTDGEKLMESTAGMFNDRVLHC